MSNTTKRKINTAIQTEIVNIAKRNPGTDTRLIISMLSNKYNEPKQRISGNLSWVEHLGLVSITSTKYHSKIS